LNRQKSISSQALSISAWNAVLLWPSIVAAFTTGRQEPARRSAALRNTAARSSKRIAAQARWASTAVSAASRIRATSA
jgi:hypothetical protein